MEEKSKKKRSMLIITMILAVPLVFVLTFMLLSYFGFTHPLLFAGFTLTGAPFAIGICIAFAFWLKKKEYDKVLKVMISVIVLAVLLAFVFFALCFYSIMTDPGLR